MNQQAGQAAGRNVAAQEQQQAPYVAQYVGQHPPPPDPQKPSGLKVNLTKQEMELFLASGAPAGFEVMGRVSSLDVVRTEFLIVAKNPATPSNKLTYGCFYLSQIPGCCGIVVLHDSGGGASNKQQFAKAVMTLATRLAIEANYSQLMITDNYVDRFGKDTLLKEGWTEMFKPFCNRNSGNTVYGLIKTIWEPAETR